MFILPEPGTTFPIVDTSGDAYQMLVPDGAKAGSKLTVAVVPKGAEEGSEFTVQVCCTSLTPFTNRHGLHT